MANIAVIITCLFVFVFVCVYICVRNSMEYLFLQNIITTRMQFSLVDFADHVYYWNSYKDLSYFCIVQLDVMRSEINSEVERVERVKRRERAAKARKERKREVLKLRRQRAIDNGQNPNEIDMAKLEAEVNAEISSGSDSDGSWSGSGSDGEGEYEAAADVENVEGGKANGDDDDFDIPEEMRLQMEKDAKPVSKLKKKF